jgi:hypothetical protein
VAFDAEAVVDLGVVAFAEQRRVVQGCVAVVGEPFEQVVDVAEPVRCVAAGEDAAAVAFDDGAADVRRNDPLVAADVEGEPVGVEQHPGDRGVAGQPARPGRGQGAVEAGAGRARVDRGIEEVGQRDGHDQVRLHRPQRGQPPGGQGQVGQLDEGVAAPLGGGALVAGAAGRGGDGLDRGGDLLATDLVELEGAVPGSREEARHRERPALGGVGLGAVGVEAGHVEVHGLTQPLVGHRRRQCDQLGLDPGHVHALLGSLLEPGRRRDRCDDRDLLGGDLTSGERRLGHRHRRQGPPGVHQPADRATGQAGVRAQPRLHRLQPVALGRLDRLGPPDGAGQLGVDAVAGTHQLGCSDEQVGLAEHEEVVGGEPIERRLQLAHGHLPGVERMFEV